MSVEPLDWALAVTPAGRSSVPIKYVAELNARALSEDTPRDLEFGYLDISAIDSLGNVSEPTQVVFADAPSRARRVIAPRDVLVSTVRTYLRAIARVPQYDDLVIASTGFAVVTPKSNIDPDYLFWWLRSDPLVEQIVAQSVGVSYPAINASDIGRMKVSLPAMDDQARAASYLNSECGRIDDLIAEQQRQLQLLAERRQAELNGLLLGTGQRVGTKTVRVPWAVEVPREWEVMSLRFCTEMLTVGIVVNPSAYYEPDGVPCLRGLNVSPGHVSENDLVYMSDESNLLHSKSMLRPDDIVIVRTGNAGAAAVVPSWAVGGNAIDLLLVRPGPRFDAQFLEYVLNSDFARDQITYNSVGALQAHFNVGSLTSLKVPCPPIEIQRDLVAKIALAVGRIDELAAEITTSVALLQEHKHALITAVMTGQKEVA